MMPSSVQAAAEDRVVLVGATVTLTVVSADSEVVALCRDVLRELEDTAPILGTLPDSDAARTSEVCLWDYEFADFTAPVEQFGGSTVFYLVPPEGLKSLLNKAPEAEGRILLKPVTRAVLRAFLGSMAPCGKKENAEVVILRADRDDLLQNLLQANLRLQEYDQQRTNFIARAVHDFRAPLTALSGFCGLLTGGQLGPLSDQQREALSRMEHSTKRLSRMASAMFELSIGSKVDHKPELRKGDIREQIMQALHEIKPVAREKQILIKADAIEPPVQLLYFDSGQIEQVLLNLLDNACKFTHRKGVIDIQGYSYFWERRFLAGGSASGERRVRTVQTPNSYRVDIRDTGPGIPDNYLNRIFEEYTSYSGSQDRSGGGLGLAICRLIMSRHGGHIWANSCQSGAIFSFVLPHHGGSSGNAANDTSEPPKTESETLL